MFFVEAESSDAPGVHVDHQGAGVGAEAEDEEEFSRESGCVVGGGEGAFARQVTNLLLRGALRSFVGRGRRKMEGAGGHEGLAARGYRRTRAIVFAL